MSTPKINVRPIEAFEVTDEAGNPVAFVRVKERWHGLAHLTTDDGQSLIVDDPDTFAAQFGKAYAQIFGGNKASTFTLHLIKASPDLMARLGFTKEGAKS